MSGSIVYYFNWEYSNINRSCIRTILSTNPLYCQNFVNSMNTVLDTIENWSNSFMKRHSVLPNTPEYKTLSDKSTSFKKDQLSLILQELTRVASANPDYNDVYDMIELRKELL